ncbi:uncharacterized protein PFL1_05743 [Pseudozyma flocculosa PF-1]|uniref:Related to YPC1 - Alkaline ceramidase n=2 Tax=Pseudozyma flocculosa TaxID=84751 RepID=A0A5C3F9M1_9BASI|nr:uncharacterized protein PFL1_05743 [Pseudozyma flocculosa PF-1]EPQ26764.1 hypothetical protein PFL1_05743 [Pseudozyma flocculosa PF-1]SPO40910.1 related to YPC1 - Alkaline ceramidase [Pseudozyma flocculosa]
MTSYRPATPPPEGYWGPITSSLFWCEEKYRWSRYVAEPANTLSNLFFVVVALYGVARTRGQRLPLRFVLAHFGVAFVGVGSTLFHATLKREMQLLDELPMIYTSALLTYAVLETSPGYRSRTFPILLALFLLALVSSITWTYLHNQDPVFHQVAFATLLLSSTFREWYLLHHPSSPLSSSSSSSSSSPLINQRKREITSLNAKGAIIFALGFVIWNIDNLFCAQLTAWRHAIGYPAAWALQGHAWWHLFTGYGSYCLNVASTQLVVSVKEHPENVRLVPGFLPYVERVRPFDEGAPRQADTKKRS